MGPRWERVDQIFHSAVELPKADRSAFLDRACEGDEDLRREVESLLSHDHPTDPFVQAALAAVVAPPTLPIGETVGLYRITGILGEGGMGVVYEAEQANRGVPWP